MNFSDFVFQFFFDINTVYWILIKTNEYAYGFYMFSIVSVKRFGFLKRLVFLCFYFQNVLSPIARRGAARRGAARRGAACRLNGFDP